jgi:copper chaperone CopZ
MMRFVMLTVVTSVLVSAVPAGAAEVKVELKKVHMCCEGCTKAVATILQKVPGVIGVAIAQKTNTARFTAADDQATQRALDTLAQEGFHGDTGGAKGYAFKDDSGVKPGTVKTLMVTGFHNSCGGCVKAFREAIKDVKGVTGDSLKAKVSSAEVTGAFEAAELVAALNKGGFHVKVK